MEIKELTIKGLFEISFNPKMDSRGFFMRVYDKEEFRKWNIDRDWLQENHSRSEKKGIIRGLHFQLSPFDETKLVRCINGAVFDVAVDMRPDSESFGHWAGVELTAGNRKALYIPRGFAHGFCTLSDVSEVLYKVDNYYSPENERGLLWNDPDLAIDWPVKNPILSDKDRKNLTLKAFLEHE